MAENRWSMLESDLSDELGFRPVPLTFPDEHPNLHYRVGPFFVKVFLGASRYFDRELAAYQHLSPHVRVPAVRRSGRSSEDLPWIAFEWHELKPVEVGMELAEAAGAMLGCLHAGPVEHSRLAVVTLDEIRPRIRQLCERIAGDDQSLASRIAGLELKFPDPIIPQVGYTCLIHGDFGWRNVKRDDSNRLWLIDFEHARLGHPFLEFAKLWDRELADRSIRTVFLDAYASAAALPAPSEQEMFLIRLWAAAGIFPYARAQDDKSFAAHGMAILDRLESAGPDGVS